MIDVFFRGYGVWIEDRGRPSPYATKPYLACGVFKLSKTDEIAFRHTRNLDNTEILLPSSHPDSEFLRMCDLNDPTNNDQDYWIGIDDEKYCHFVINQTLILKAIEPFAEIKSETTEQSENGKIVIKNDLINLVTLSKVLALHHRMTNSEACDWVTKVVSNGFPIYDVSWQGLPQLYDDQERAPDLVLEVFNQNWWNDPQREKHQIPGCNFSIDEIAILKSDASKHFNISIIEIDDLSQTIKIKDDELSGNVAPVLPISELQLQHISKDLITLNKAAYEFWSTADPDDKTTHPTTDQVADWLKSKGYSDICAKQGAVIIRPEWAASGRRPTK